MDYERMQLNPSTDSYEDYGVDDASYENSDDNEYNGEYEETAAYEGEGEQRQEREENEKEPELLPKAKSLVQSAIFAVNEDKKEEEKEHGEDEEDMGYDEDDERIAIAVERPRQMRPGQDDDKEFMNEEGSGESNGKIRTAFNRYKHKFSANRLRVDQLDKYRKKQQKLLTEDANKEEVDPRESSGNFANDDEDDDDYESDEDENSDGFFHSKRKSSNRYFRKNTNDAIKIISTPLGKVGIVYQQTPVQDDEKKQETTEKKASLFTDFDALAPDPESSHRLASSHPKITPVLTPDGKVALLYRGDSENSKYEPIRNLTHKFNSKNDATDNNKSSAANNKSIKLDSQDNDSSDDDSFDELENGEQNGESDLNTDQIDAMDNTNLKANDEVTKISSVVPTGRTGSFIIRPTDSILPMINRPLSEVLGIKKNQFKQFRIKDTITTVTTETLPRSLAGAPSDHSDTTTLHFLTKVNLAEFPTSTRTRNQDFDFSRDNTMLDERTRRKNQELQQQQQQQTSESQTNTIANADVLSKTEVVNLAIIPHFDEELERLQRLREHESRRHHRQRHRHKSQTEEDLSGIHCIMQAMMGIAAISTVFGMLGTFFKQRILDQLRLMHW